MINRQEIIAIALYFKKICKQHDIWYSLDRETLLGIEKHGGFVPWYEKFSVMIKLESYHKLKRLFPQHIIDSSIDANYKDLTVSFVYDNDQWRHDVPFVEIRIALPSTIAKVKQFTSWRSRLKILFSTQRENIKQAINDLYEPQTFDGYYLLESRKLRFRNNWLQILTGKIAAKQFYTHDFNTFKEKNQYLQNTFGKNYLMDNKVPTSWYEYSGPQQKAKVS